MLAVERMKPFLGAHIKGAGGLIHIPQRAAEIGAECIQIFGASPYQWQVKLPKKSEIEAFAARMKTYKIDPVFLHAAYLVNLASPDTNLFEKSVTSLIDHMKIATLLGAEGLIFHLGSSHDKAKEKAVEKTIQGMKKVLEAVPGEVQLIMENSAGGGGKLGSFPDEIGALFRGVHSKRVKVCLDTAHAFESGLIEQYTPSLIKNLLQSLDTEFGLENLVALHVNDSKTGPGSHHDRHQNLGEGYIGLSGFQNLSQEKKLAHTAWILEVPGFDSKGPDKRNMDILQRLFT